MGKDSEWFVFTIRLWLHPVKTNIKHVLFCFEPIWEYTGPVSQTGLSLSQD